MNKKLNEELIEIDLNQKTASDKLKHIKRYGSFDRSMINRLNHLLFQYNAKGKPLIAEKIASLLLGAVNLNYYSKSYPFADLKVEHPINGITIQDEYISMKSSSTKNTLSRAVTDVNGFKLSQLILFIIEKMQLNIFRDLETKTIRGSMRKDIILNTYYKFMQKCDDDRLRDKLFERQLYYIVLFQKYIDEKLRHPSYIEIKKISDFKSILFGIILNQINSESSTDYTSYFENVLSSEFKGPKTGNPTLNYELMKRVSVEYEKPKDITYLSYLPETIADMKASFCILYIENSKNSKDVIFSLQKTNAMKISELLKRSFDRWMKMKYHAKVTRGAGKMNVYFNFKDIVEVFDQKNTNEFDTHLRVIVNRENIENFEERPREQTKEIIRVIDEIKGLPYDISDDILDQFEKIIKSSKYKDKKRVKDFITKFDEFYDKYNKSYKKEKKPIQQSTTQPNKNINRSPRLKDLERIMKARNIALPNMKKPLI